ncbi:MAG: threonine ammonia-lyase [Actinomycetota bacterium]|nr:MAG: threonine ammonia-lyase [Actinomycetota bacterium]
MNSDSTGQDAAAGLGAGSVPAVPITVATVRQARDELRGVIRETPMSGARWLADRVGGPVWLKCENLQRAGSFKIRGAYTRMARLPPGDRVRGVVAASAGNHAQGVAVAAQLLGITATVFMPEGAPLPKVSATRAYGADVRLAGSSVDEALGHAVAFAEATGAVLIHPFDHADIVAGQGTVGLEILEQCPDVRTVVVAAGGGGLLAGIALVLKQLRPEIRVVGVQAAGAAALPASLAAGHPVPLSTTTTMADGIAVGRPGELTVELVRRYVDEITTVSEEQISQALLLCLERAKLVVEPAGVVSVAALLAGLGGLQPPVVAVLSGGNVDPLLLLRVIRHGMAAAGRYVSLAVRMADRPGSLARLLAELGDVGANVVEVEHRRTDPLLAIDEVDVVVAMETRGPEHCDAVVARLRERGYAVRDRAD